MSRAQLHKQLVILGSASLACVLMFITSVMVNRHLTHWYLLYNVFLAWIPVALALALPVLQKHRLVYWSIVLLWLLFLPNTFYVVTDMFHILDVRRANVDYDSLLFFVPMIVSWWLGLLSMQLVQKYVSSRPQFIWIVAVLASIGIWLGRIMRWNSWDVIANPIGIMRDLFGTLSNPAELAYAGLMIAAFTVMIAASYYSYRYLLRD